MRKLLRAWGLCFGTMLLTLMAACRGPEKAGTPPEPVLPRRDLPFHYIVRVQLLGIREVVKGRPESLVPAAGFRFEDNRLVPTTEPGTVAGVKLTRESLVAWLAELRRTGAGGLYMAPAFTVKPGRRAAASRTLELPYRANVTFDRNGACTMKNGTLATGTRLSVTAIPTLEADTLLLKLDLRITSGEVQWFTAADGFRSRDFGRAPPLKVQLAAENVHAIATALPVQYGRPVIAAHYVKQYWSRSGLFGGWRQIREHLICIATAVRTGTVADPGDTPDVYEESRFHAATLLWCAQEGSASRGHGGGSSADAEGGKFVSRWLNAQAVRKTLAAAYGGTERTVFLLGIVVAPGVPARFEVGERQAYVADIVPPPVPARAGPYEFAILTATSGTVFCPRLDVADRSATVHVNVRLGSPARLKARSETLPTLRADHASGITETYHFSTTDQAIVEMDGRLGLRVGGAFRLGMTSIGTGAGPSTGSRGSNDTPVLLTLRKLP